MKQVIFYVLLGLNHSHNRKGVIHGGEATCVTPISIFLINYVDLQMDNILLGLPSNPNTTIEEFLSSLDPSHDMSGPITTPVLNMNMLGIHLTDLDLGQPISHTLSSLLLIKLHYHSSFTTQSQPPLFPYPTRGIPCSWGDFRCPLSIFGTSDVWWEMLLSFTIHIAQSNMIPLKACEMATSRSLFLPVVGVSDKLGQLSHMVKCLGDFLPALIKASSLLSLQYFELGGVGHCCAWHVQVPSV